MAGKRYRRGLIVGKFSPLHQGHEHLIRSAQAVCDAVILISYCRPEFPSCSPVMRERWLKDFAPDATVLVVDAATVEQWRSDGRWQLPMPHNADAADRHREFTAQLIAQKLETRVDAVFTSEDYGDGFARYMSDAGLAIGAGVEHVCVDIDRRANPVSGSALRDTPVSSAVGVSHAVMRDFRVKKICFLGGESTGKTTLSATLARAFGEPVVDEYGRRLWEEKNSELTPQDLISICQRQTANEDLAQRRARHSIFCDTSPLTTLAYSESLFESRPGIVEAFAERPYHQVFLCAPDFPFTQDGTRQSETFRQWQNDWYLAELDRRRIPFERLTGSIEERIGQVRRAIGADGNIDR